MTTSLKPSLSWLGPSLISPTTSGWLITSQDQGFSRIKVPVNEKTYIEKPVFLQLRPTLNLSGMKFHVLDMELLYVEKGIVYFNYMSLQFRSGKTNSLESEKMGLNLSDNTLQLQDPQILKYSEPQLSQSSTGNTNTTSLTNVRPKMLF